MAELISGGDGGRAHRPVFMRALGPRDAGVLVDPQGETHTWWRGLQAPLGHGALKLAAAR